MEALKLFGIGIIFGIANVIPGVSGGTIAVVFNVYDKIINVITLNLKKMFSQWKFLLPFGSGIVMISAIVIMSLMSKIKFKNFIYIGLLGLFAIVIMIISEPYRIERIIAYVDPFSDPLGSGFQIIQSLFALSPGGILGKGINSSIQKHFYLPEPQTDFIFAIISEEYGLIGSLIIIILFGVLFYYGLNLSLKQKKYKYSLLIIGIISLIGVQVIINLGVVVGLLPVTGITLPFISYGGSSLIILDIGIGLVLNLAREENNWIF